jgi:nucleoside-diphosphate-sugar epimerase
MVLLDALRTRAPRAHLVLPSTAAVYGSAPIFACRAAIVANEKTRLAPATPHAAAAIAAESYAMSFARSFALPVTVLRMATVYGSGIARSSGALALDEGIVGRLLEASLPGGCLVDPPGAASPIDLVHVDDVCRAIAGVWSLATACAGRVFNVGGGARQAPAFALVASRIVSLAGPLRVREGDPAEAVPAPHVLDVRRLRRVTGWRPAIGWAEGLARAVAAARVSMTRETLLESPLLQESFQTSRGPALVAWPRAEGLA